MAKQMIDIALKDNEDLLIVSGDWITTESTERHQQQLILNNNADYKQNPTIGVGVFDYLDDENYQDLTREISREFAKDGMDVKSVTIGTDGSLKTDAYYP